MLHWFPVTSEKQVKTTQNRVKHVICLLLAEIFPMRFRMYGYQFCRNCTEHVVLPCGETIFLHQPGRLWIKWNAPIPHSPFGVVSSHEGIQLTSIWHHIIWPAFLSQRCLLFCPWITDPRSYLNYSKCRSHERQWFSWVLFSTHFNKMKQLGSSSQVPQVGVNKLFQKVKRYHLGCLMEVENHPKWRDTHIGDTPMFHEKPWLLGGRVLDLGTTLPQGASLPIQPQFQTNQAAYWNVNLGLFAIRP